MVFTVKTYQSIISTALQGCDSPEEAFGFFFFFFVFFGLAAASAETLARTCHA